MKKDIPILKSRIGMTMMELLGVMFIIVVLLSIGTGVLRHAQEKSRVSAAQEAVSGYRDAFTNMCVSYPGLVNERENSGLVSGVYSSERGLAKLVGRMNSILEESLVLTWDPTLKAYVSRQGADPWGGAYILTEYPIPPAGVTAVSYYNPAAEGQSTMCVSVWATGNNDSILQDAKVSKHCYGAGFVFQAGLVTTKFQGFNDKSEFVDWTLKFQ